MATTRGRAFSYILGALLLAVGAPAISALIEPVHRPYLLQPLIYVWQPIPYVLASALWLPWRSTRAIGVSLVLARLLFVAAALLYIPIVTGMLGSRGGDMVGLTYIYLSMVTTAAVLVATLAGFGLSWILARRAVARRP